jgi:hypothetical protein
MVRLIQFPRSRSFTKLAQLAFVPDEPTASHSNRATEPDGNQSDGRTFCSQSGGEFVEVLALHELILRALARVGKRSA